MTNHYLYLLGTECVRIKCVIAGSTYMIDKLIFKFYLTIK